LLAQKVEKSQDGKTYIFTIPSNVVFHDGTPLTAEDVKFSYDLYHKFPGSARYQETIFFQNVQVINNTTIQLNLKKPVPEIADKLTNLYILPKHIWENHTDTEASTKAYTNNPPSAVVHLCLLIIYLENLFQCKQIQALEKPPKIEYMILDI
jgi:peptide/nickel transport system substrate-binding protein